VPGRAGSPLPRSRLLIAAAVIAIDVNGTSVVFEHACRLGLEGVVSKHRRRRPRGAGVWLL